MVFRIAESKALPKNKLDPINTELSDKMNY